MYSSYTRLLAMDESRRKDAKRILMDSIVSLVENPEAVTLWHAKDPIDLEMEFGMLRGNVDHGIFAFENAFEKRRSIRSEQCASNLVISGSGFVAGGLVSGIPGLLAAREAIKLM